MSGARSSVEKKLEIISKSESKVRVAHEYERNENIGLSQEGGTCADIFNDLDNRNIKMEHDPTGLGRWTSIRIQGKEGV